MTKKYSRKEPALVSRNKHFNPYEYLNSEDYETSNVEQILDALIAKHQTPEAPQTATPTPSSAEDAPSPFVLSDTKSVETHNRELAIQALESIYRGHTIEDMNAARQQIKHMVKFWGLSYIDNLEHYPLSREEKHVIRMDFYGTIGEPSKDPNRHRLTYKYLKLISDPKRPKLPPQDYDLASSPGWQIYAQFPRFRKLENDVLRQLQQMNIPSELISQMNTYDFSDVLFQRFKDNLSENGNAHIFLGARQSFIKDFIRKNEKPFRNYLALINLDPRYTEELIRQMKQYGSTSNLYIIDHERGIKLLHHYRQKGYPFPGNINKRLSNEQIDYIRSRGDFNKAAFIDEDNKPIKAPDFSVHHKAAVNDAAAGPYLAAVNNFENLCLTVDYPYHRFLHCLDITQTVGRRESYKARIYLPKDMVFWGGFHPDYHIRYDYSQDPKTLKQHNNYKRWKAARNKAMQPEDTSVKHERLPRKTKKRLQKQQQPLISKTKAKRLSQIINALYLHAQGR